MNLKFIFLAFLLLIFINSKAQIIIQKPQAKSKEGKLDVTLESIEFGIKNTFLTILVNGSRQKAEDFIIVENKVHKNATKIEEVTSELIAKTTIKKYKLTFPALKGETVEIDFFEDCIDCFI